MNRQFLYRKNQINISILIYPAILSRYPRPVIQNHIKKFCSLRKNSWIDKYGNVYLIFPIEELSVQIDKCKSSVKTALKELDDEGLLVRRSGGFSKPNHLYVKIPSDEIGLQPVENKAVEKMAVTEAEKQPSSSCKNGCAEAGNVAPSKVTEKYKRNKYHEVNYCYGEGESL